MSRLNHLMKIGYQECEQHTYDWDSLCKIQLFGTEWTLSHYQFMADGFWIDAWLMSVFEKVSSRIANTLLDGEGGCVLTHKVQIQMNRQWSVTTISPPLMYQEQQGK